MKKSFIVVRILENKKTFKIVSKELFQKKKNAMVKLEECIKKNSRCIYAIQEVYFNPKVIG